MTDNARIARIMAGTATCPDCGQRLMECECHWQGLEGYDDYITTTVVDEHVATQMKEGHE